MDSDNTKVPLYKRPLFIAILVIVVIMIVVFVRNRKPTPKNAKEVDEGEKDEKDEDEEKFIASGGRSDSNGGDWALRDKINDINEKQRKYVRSSEKMNRYDARQDSAAPAVYSPEDELQQQLYDR
jgi:hypothetical protein